MINIGMSTSCVYPLSVEDGFRYSWLTGFDGVEVMVTNDKRTQSARELRELSHRYEQPILSIHAPVLLLTHFVWGRDPKIKLQRSAELAAEVGASSVVVHPPFRWQAGYAEEFLDIVRATEAEYGVDIAVENMFPWKIRGKSMDMYSPGPDPRLMDCDSVTLDFSHAALSGFDALELAHDFGDRLKHVHLCDGQGPDDDARVFDEHLLPGEGGQPVAQVLQHLRDSGWSGNIVAEVNTRKAKTPVARLELLRRTLEFARDHTSAQLAVA